jgi:hypothetical protein
VLPQSASSAFLLVQVLVVTLLHRLLQEVHGFGFGFCGGCLGLKMGLGLGFVAAGAPKELVVVVLWRLGAGAAGFW